MTGDPKNDQKDTKNKELILKSDVLPNMLCIIPQDNTPFMPGQLLHVVMSAEIWNPTFEKMQSMGQNVIGILTTEKEEEEEKTDQPDIKNFHTIGTACRILKFHKENNQLQCLIEGIKRFKVNRWIKKTRPLIATVDYPVDQKKPKSKEVKSYVLAVMNTIRELIPLSPLCGEEFKIFLTRANSSDPSLLADFAASITSSSKEDLLEILNTIPLLPRLQKVLVLLHKEIQIATAQFDLRTHVENEIQDHQRKAFLREQLKFIQKELGLAKDDKTTELENFQERIDKLSIPKSAMKQINAEMQKFSLLEVGSPEYTVTRNYLDWLTSLPWEVYSKDITDLKKAIKSLNKHHEGLQDIKDHIIEFIAVGIKKGNISGSIILFVGPPGVGKTSLGRSIASALNRKFYRFSVGGMRDEAEIKGHRRTYVGAMPGKLIQALKETETSNPVIMLDEVDKITQSYQGDPASALLEVLDPEQNQAFRDHYLDTPFDLSKILFVCTANQTDTIPPPLLDRMDVIRLSGYLSSEKLTIARKHLLPKQIKQAGLERKGELTIHPAAMKKIIEEYSREAGIRQLEKHLARITKKTTLKILQGATPPIIIKATDVVSYLGQPKYTEETKKHGIGVVMGLAWTTLGGATLPVEAIAVHHNKKGFTITGQLGDVMKESASIAYSYAVHHAERFNINPSFFENAHIHLHAPAGATPKDGPSAGITMTTALISLALNQACKSNFAMTGELTLTGEVFPVGGIREKLIAAKRQNYKNVIIPQQNEKDFVEIPEHITKGIKVFFVSHYSEVQSLVFNQKKKTKV